MKTLNRPMFRYGGPIKEGIMNGIKEPRQNYKEAGDVKKAPVDRSYKFSQTPIAKGVSGLVNYGPNAAIAAAYDLVGVPINTLGRMFNYNPGLSGTKFVDTLTGGNFSKQTGYDRDKAKFLGFNTSAKKGFTQPQMQEKISDIINDDKTPKVKKTPEQVELEKENAILAKAEFADKEKARRLENYRKIMDIEGMNKDAAYDSLIAASQAIQETPDFKGSIKDGSLINKMIQGASKAYDKPKDTKDAINTLILKSQMAADTPSTALKDLIALGIDTPEKQEMYLRTKMGLPVNLGAAKAVATKSGAIGDAITIQAAQSMYGDDYKGVIMDKDTFTKRFEEATDKGAGRPNEIITGLIADEARTNEYPPGKYSVGDVVVTIDEEFNVKIER
jgi:hypothetical protein